MAVLALSLPLALQQATHGELLFACTAGRRSTVPLASRSWLAFSGPIVYASVSGWVLVAAAGLFLCTKRWRKWAPAAGIAGFCAVVFAAWFACQVMR